MPQTVLSALIFVFLLNLQVYIGSSEIKSSTRMATDNEINRTIRNLYKSIELSEDHKPDWALLRSQFMDGAHLIHVTESENYKLTLEDFISNYREQIENGALISFKEVEIHRVEESFGNIVHAFSTYEATFTTADGDSNARGINSIQLMKEDGQWKIVSLIWFDENADQPIPPEYLPKN